jgi:hypothetical protein
MKKVLKKLKLDADLGMSLPDPSRTKDGGPDAEYLLAAHELSRSPAFRGETEQALFELFDKLLEADDPAEMRACKIAARTISARYDAIRKLAQQYEELATNQGAREDNDLAP